MCGVHRSSSFQDQTDKGLEVAGSYAYQTSKTVNYKLVLKAFPWMSDVIMFTLSNLILYITDEET